MKKIISMSLILIILFSVAFLSSKGYSIVNTSSKINNISTIIIDAGHPALKNTKNTIDF